MDVRHAPLLKEIFSLSQLSLAMCSGISRILSCYVERMVTEQINPGDVFKELGKISLHNDFYFDPQVRKAYYRFCQVFSKELNCVSLKAGDFEVSIPLETLKIRSPVLASAINFKEGRHRLVDLSIRYEQYQDYQKEFQDFLTFLKGEPIKLNKSNFLPLMRFACEYDADQLKGKCMQYLKWNLMNFDLKSLKYVWEFADQMHLQTWQLEILMFFKNKSEWILEMNPGCQKAFCHINRFSIKFNLDASWTMHLFCDKDLGSMIKLFNDCDFLRRCSNFALFPSTIEIGYTTNAENIKTLLSKNNENPLFKGLKLNLTPLIAKDRKIVLYEVLKNPYLLSLSLANCKIDDKEAIVIAENLSKTIQHLDLSHNNINNEGALKLADLLKNRSTLQNINLTSNPTFLN